VKNIHRTAAKTLVGVGELLARNVHRDEGVEINIGVHGDGVGLLFRDRRLRPRGE